MERPQVGGLGCCWGECSGDWVGWERMGGGSFVDDFHEHGCSWKDVGMAKTVAGRRVLVTGAARGGGAALAQRLSERGAVVGLVGLEKEELAGVAARCGGAPW